MTDPVLLGTRVADPLLGASLAQVVPEDVDAHLALARGLTAAAPPPGGGSTRLRWELLASLGAADLGAARVVEAHLDAVAILAESDADPDLVGTTWGVYAAEGAGVRLDEVDGMLTGTKPWCSLATRLSHALVTAHTTQGRRLFAVDLHHPGVTAEVDAWHARGLVDVPSGPVTFDAVPATPVGAAGWYLSRPGFAYGGLGVAAAWFGGAVGVARALLAAAQRRPPDDVALWHLGRVDATLHRARCVLADAAQAVDAGAARGQAGEVLALRARTVIADAAEVVLSCVGHALGPAPLALDDAHARRVSDLTLYLRQHHAERDEVSLGRTLLAGVRPW